MVSDVHVTLPALEPNAMTKRPQSSDRCRARPGQLIGTVCRSLNLSVACLIFPDHADTGGGARAPTLLGI
jgi:hypothetical protein